MSLNKNMYIILVLIISSIKPEYCNMGKLIFDKTTNSNKGQPPIRALIGVDDRKLGDKNKSSKDLYCSFSIEKSLFDVFSSGPTKVFYRFQCSFKVYDSGYLTTSNEFREYDLDLQEMQNLFLNGVSYKKDEVIIEKSRETIPEIYQIYLENANLENFEKDIILDSSVLYPQAAVLAFKNEHAIILDSNGNLSTGKAYILI